MHPPMHQDTARIAGDPSAVIPQCDEPRIATKCTQAHHGNTAVWDQNPVEVIGVEYQLNYVRLLVENYRDTLRFYRDTLKLPVHRGDLESNYVEFDTPGMRLALLQRSEMTRALGMEGANGEGRKHVALAFSVPDVDQAFQDLEATGVRFVMAPRTHEDWNLRTAHFRDPDGNLLEINQRLA